MPHRVTSEKPSAPSPARAQTRIQPHDIACVAGVACLLACLQSSGFYPLSLLPDAAQRLPHDVALLHLLYAVVCIVASLGICQSFSRVHLLLRTPVAHMVAGFAGCLGSTLLVLASNQQTAVEVAGAALVAVFVCLSVFQWGEALREAAGREGAMRTCLMLAWSFMASQLLTMLGCIAGPAQTLVFCLAPMACGAAGAALPALACNKSDRPALQDALNGGTACASLRQMIGLLLFLVYFCTVFIRILVTSYTGDAPASLKFATTLVAALACAGMLLAVRMAVGQAGGPDSERTALLVTFALTAAFSIVAMAAMLVLDGHHNALVRRVLVAAEHLDEALVAVLALCLVLRGGARPHRACAFYVVFVAVLPWVLSFDLFYLAGLADVVDASEVLVPATAAALALLALGVIAYLASMVRRLMNGPGSPMAEAAAADGDALVGRACARAGLAPRELDVARLLYRGYSARRVAEELCLGEQTVKNYTSRVYRKLGVTSKQEFIALVEEFRPPLETPGHTA